MPSRGMILSIVVFWLCSMGLLFYLEVLPYFQAGDVPPFVIEITDEVGSAEVAWNLVLKRGNNEEKPIRIQSRIDPLGGGEFDMVNECTENFELGGLHFRKVRFVYRVTKRGELRGLTIEGEFTHKQLFFKGKYDGKVRDGMLHAEYDSNIFGRGVLPPKEFSQQAGALNPMQLLNKLRGLHEGREWTVAVFDPLGILINMVVQQAPSMPNYRAKVVADTLEWDGKRVECMKIEYFDMQKRGKPHAATWVRKADDVILKQWTTFEGSEFTAIRLPQV